MMEAIKPVIKMAAEYLKEDVNLTFRNMIVKTTPKEYSALIMASQKGISNRAASSFVNCRFSNFVILFPKGSLCSKRLINLNILLIPENPKG